MSLRLSEAALTAMVDEIMSTDESERRHPGPGWAIGVHHEGSLAWCTFHGTAVLEHSVPVSSTTVFDAAAIAQQMTAMCAALLADRGVIDLDGDARQLVPELKTEGVTIRQCLSQTSGLNDYLELSSVAGRAPEFLSNVTDFLSWLEQSSGTAFGPDERFGYSETNYVLAAIAISRASGLPLKDLIREVIIDPLGMSAVAMRTEMGQIIPHLAFSYSPRAQGGFSRHEMLEVQVGGSGLYGSIETLGPWHEAMSGTARLIGLDQLALLEPIKLENGQEIDRSMFGRLQKVGGQTAVLQNGTKHGYQSSIITVPHLRLGVTVLSNGRHLSASRLADQLVDRIVNCGRSASADSGPPPSPQPVLALSEREGPLRPDAATDPAVMCGEYEIVDIPAHAQIYTRSGATYLQVGTGRPHELRHSSSSHDEIQFAVQDIGTLSRSLTPSDQVHLTLPRSRVRLLPFCQES